MHDFCAKLEPLRQEDQLWLLNRTGGGSGSGGGKRYFHSRDGAMQHGAKPTFLWEKLFKVACRKAASDRIRLVPKQGLCLRTVSYYRGLNTYLYYSGGSLL